MRIYTVTKLGKTVGGDISSSPSESKDVLQMLRESPSDVSEIASATGIPKTRAKGIVRSLCRRRLAMELTGGSRSGEMEPEPDAYDTWGKKYSMGR